MSNAKATLTPEQDEFLHKFANIIISRDGAEEFEFTCKFKHKADSLDYEIIYSPADYLKAKIAHDQSKKV